MQNTAVRFYGANDLRIEAYEFPEIKDDEILTEIVTNSVCMSDFKEAEQGTAHKRVPKDLATNPTIIGHEMCGRILKVGAKWKDQFKPGELFSLQPAITPPGVLKNPGYAFPYCGGYSFYSIIPPHIMEQDGLLKFKGRGFFMGSLSEPMSCIVGTFHAMYHTTPRVYVHDMGIVEGGNMAILAGVGPMGLGAIDYAIHCDRKPGLLVVTDIDETRLKRAESLLSVEEAAKNGVKLVYVNTKGLEDPVAKLRSYTKDDKGFDDVIIMAPVKSVVEQGDAILGNDGCLNFFSGPIDKNFSALFNFYNVHYSSHHIVGTSGGSTEDMVESLEMMAEGKLTTAVMITHIGGLLDAPNTILTLPSIPGGKKLMYTHYDIPLTAIEDFAEKGKTDPMFAKLDEICKAHNGLWCVEAEDYLLEHAKRIDK